VRRGRGPLLAACVVLGGGCDPAPATSTARSVLLAEDLTIPDDQELAAQIAAALEVKRLGDAERAIDALEPGEQLSHVTLSQVALDRQVFTLADLFRAGDDLFAYQFRTEQGLGNALAGRAGILAGGGAAPNQRRVHQGAFGGPDASGCADCHAVGGDDGAGTLTQAAYLAGDGDHISSADARTAPMLLGGGPIERLAAEMTAAPGVQRDPAVANPQGTGAPGVQGLAAKGRPVGAL